MESVWRSDGGANTIDAEPVGPEAASAVTVASVPVSATSVRRDGGPAEFGQHRDPRARLPGFELERFGAGLPVVLGQDLSEVTGPIRDGATANLAAGDRKPGNGYREAAGRSLAHLLL